MGKKKSIKNPNSPPASAHPNLLHRIWPVLALCASALLAYSNSFQAAFSLDSRGILLQDRIHAATAQNLHLILDHTYWWPYGESGLYRPVTTLTYLFNYAILGNAARPAGYHVINLLLHLGNVLLAYLLARRLLNARWQAFAAAALWAVHPVLTEAVTNIAGRADLLAAASLLGGLLLYLRSAEVAGSARWPYLAALTVTGLVGVFSKENAAVLIALIALAELTRPRDRIRRHSLALGCLAVLPSLAALAAARARILSNLSPLEIPFLDNPLTGAGFWTAKLTALRIIANYLGLLIWPASLSWDYSYNQIPLAAAAAGIAASLLVITIAAVLAYRLNRPVFFAIGFAAITFLPTSNLIIPIGTIMAERFLYLPAFAFSLCLVAAASSLEIRLGYRRLAPAALTVIGVLLAARTLARNADWRDPVSITEAGAAASPNSYKTHGALALALFEADPEHTNLDRVIGEADKGLALLDGLPIEKMNSDVFLQAADYYKAQGDVLAATHPETPILTPLERRSYTRQLELLQRSKAIVEASYESAAARARARSTPLPGIDTAKMAELENSISGAYLKLGDPAQSAAAARAAMQRTPNSAEPYLLLASAAILEGKADEVAIALFQGLFATADLSFRAKLGTLYQNSPSGCALTSGPNGTRIDPACPIVHNHACTAAQRLIATYAGLNRADLAATVRRQASEAFACD